MVIIVVYQSMYGCKPFYDYTFQDFGFEMFCYTHEKLAISAEFVGASVFLRTSAENGRMCTALSGDHAYMLSPMINGIYTQKRRVTVELYARNQNVAMQALCLCM